MKRLGREKRRQLGARNLEEGVIPLLLVWRMKVESQRMQFTIANSEALKCVEFGMHIIEFLVCDGHIEQGQCVVCTMRAQVVRTTR